MCLWSWRMKLDCRFSDNKILRLSVQENFITMTVNHGLDIIDNFDKGSPFPYAATMSFISSFWEFNILSVHHFFSNTVTRNDQNSTEMIGEMAREEKPVSCFSVIRIPIWMLLIYMKFGFLGPEEIISFHPCSLVLILDRLVIPLVSI